MNKYSLIRRCLLKCIVNASTIVEHIQVGVRILSAMESGARPFL